ALLLFLSRARHRLVIRNEALRGIAHDGHSRGNVANGRAVIDKRFSFARGVPGVDRRYADLHFKRCRYAVERLQTVVRGVLAVRVQIDEAGRDHEAFGVDLDLTFQRRGGNGGDFAPFDSDVADRIELRGGIDDAASVQHDVVALSVREWPQRKDRG